MQRYLIRRLVLFFPTLFIASFIIFGVMRMLPGDVARVILGGDDVAVSERAVQRLREQLGLNDPLYKQYGDWMSSMLSGGFGGESLKDREPIADIVKRRFPITLQLTIYTMLVALIIAVPAGVVAAVTQDRWPDYIIRVVTILGLALPNFWVALLVVLFLVLWFNWSPPVIYANLWDDPWTHFRIVVWPVLILSWGYAAWVIRLTRSSMLEVLRQDYIRTAQSKGLAQHVVLWRHALRNALLPVTTLAGLYLGSLLGGTVILERIFGIPGLGQGIVVAAADRDYPVIQSLVMLLVFTMLAVNLLIDLLYVVIDPRISYS